MPPGPTSQQIVGDGATPDVNVAGAPVDCVCQVVPPSIERSTLPPVRSRQRMFGFGDAICVRASSILASASGRATDVATSAIARVGV